MDKPFLPKSLLILTLSILTLPILHRLLRFGNHSLRANRRNARLPDSGRQGRKTEVDMSTQTH